MQPFAVREFVDAKLEELLRRIPRLLVGDSSDNLPGVPKNRAGRRVKVTERFYSFAALKESSPDDLKSVLDSRQTLELEKALASGDLERQRRVIELKGLAKLEEAKELIVYLAKEISIRRLDENFVRDPLIRWEMSSLLLN